MRRLLAFAACTLAAFVIPAAALGGSFRLHPSGFGEHSYSAWKGQAGLPDSTGGKNQALYFQKMTTTPTVAAGVAVFEGVAGLDTADLGDLEFWWRTDGHCGAGAPRFNIRIQLAAGPVVTQFVGCQGMIQGATEVAPNGKTFEQRTFPAGGILPGTVVSLALVFDEGNDVGPGFVYLDDIKAANHIWTSASDNGGGETLTADPTGAAFVSSLLGESVATALSK
jgi:hypothetical protein